MKWSTFLLVAAAGVAVATGAAFDQADNQIELFSIDDDSSSDVRELKKGGGRPSGGKPSKPSKPGKPEKKKKLPSLKSLCDDAIKITCDDCKENFWKVNKTCVAECVNTNTDALNALVPDCATNFIEAAAKKACKKEIQSTCEDCKGKGWFGKWNSTCVDECVEENEASLGQCATDFLAKLAEKEACKAARETCGSLDTCKEKEGTDEITCYVAYHACLESDPVTSACPEKECKRKK